MGKTSDSAGKKNDELTTRSIAACGDLAKGMASARKGRDVSQVDMAKEIGTSRETIRQYEKNETKIPVYAVMKYSEKLNVPIDTLLAGEKTVDAYLEAKERGHVAKKFKEAQEKDLLEKRDKEARGYIREITDALPVLEKRELRAIAAEISAYNKDRNK